MNGHLACPRCRGVIEQSAELAGVVVSCPYCGKSFQMPKAPAQRPPVRRAAPACAAPSELPSVQPSVRPGLPRIVQSDTPASRTAARHRLMAPAILLILSCLGPIATNLCFCYLALNESGDPRAVSGARAWLVISVIGILGESFILAGAICMLAVKNYRIAKLGAILALIPCFSSCVGILVGWWAWTILDRPEIWKAFYRR